MTKVFSISRNWKPRNARPAPRVLRRASDGAAMRRILRSASSAGHSHVDSATQSTITGLDGRGRALPSSLRSYMEPRFGADFSSVKVHTDREAAQSARALNARAYTYGNHVVFDAGQYAPETTAGRRLIAHELAHVVQQQSMPPTAQRVMRSPYPGCDKKTTGVDDPDAKIDAARQEAIDALQVATAAFPRMNGNTIRLVDRHFHCPSTSQLRTIIKMLADIKTALPLLKPNCADKSESICADGESGWVWQQEKRIEFCPPAFKTDAKRKFRFPGLLIVGAAQTVGAQRLCSMLDPCYDDFTKDASDMTGNASSYAGFALELAGHTLSQPATIPCHPQDTGILVYVPPGATTNPDLIRRVTGYDDIPRGSVILSVFSDRAGNRFVYHNDLPGARVYLATEADSKQQYKRYYFPPGRAP